MATTTHPVEAVADELERLRAEIARLRTALEVTDEAVLDAAYELAHHLPDAQRQEYLFGTDAAFKTSVRDTARAILNAPRQAAIDRAIAKEEQYWADVYAGRPACR